MIQSSRTTKSRLFLVLTFLAVTASAGATLLPRETIPASAAWGLHLDFVTFKGTQTGTHLMQRELSENLFSIGILGKPFGLEVADDIEGFVLYGADLSQKNTVALVLGSFESASIKPFFESENNYREESHGEHKILIREVPLDRNGPFGQVEMLAVHPRGIAVGANLDDIKRALDVLDGQAEARQPTPIDTPVRDAIENPFLSFFANAEAIRGGIENDGLAQLVNAFRFVAGEQEDRIEGRLIATASSPERAARLKNIVEGLMAFARLSQGRDDAFPAWLQDLAIEQEEDSVRIRLSLPITEETLSQIEEQGLGIR